MNELANNTARNMMTLEGYEVQLEVYKAQAAHGLLGIGRTLNAAHAANVVPHGQWISWVEQHTGVSERTAQRWMKVAREITEGSALANLSMSTLTPLLAIPADERETFAIENELDKKSSREAERLIKEKLDAEKRADKEKARADKEKQRADEAERKRQNAMNAVSRLNVKAIELQAQLDKKPEAITVEVAPADYEQLKARDAAAARRIQEAEDYAEQSEQRVRDLEEQLSNAQMGQAQQDDLQLFIGACADFYGRVSHFQEMRPAELMRSKSRADVQNMRRWLRMIGTWANTLDNNLGGEVISSD